MRGKLRKLVEKGVGRREYFERKRKYEEMMKGRRNKKVNGRSQELWKTKREGHSGGK